MQFVVLGMHRSGTSMMTRLLNLSGAYFGKDKESTGANLENPKGFWERRDVRNLNDYILHSLGCDWDRVSVITSYSIHYTKLYEENLLVWPT